MIESVLASFKIPDVRAKLIFTFSMLIIFRFMAHVPVPGVNLAALRDLYTQQRGS